VDASDSTRADLASGDEGKFFLGGESPEEDDPSTMVGDNDNESLDELTALPFESITAFGFSPRMEPTGLRPRALGSPSRDTGIWTITGLREVPDGKRLMST
jgi:hypothetical protein